MYATSCAMVLIYWNVGRRIVEQEQDGHQRAEYGTAMMDALAAELTKEYRNRQRICFCGLFLLHLELSYLLLMRQPLLLRIHRVRSSEFFVRNCRFYIKIDFISCILQFPEYAIEFQP